MSARKASLEELVRETRDERAPEVDWEKIEGPLMARVEREARTRTAIEGYQGRTRGWTITAFALTAAAAGALFLARGSGDAGSSWSDMTRAGRDPIAGSLTWKDAQASLQLTHDGLAHDATPAETVARGDTVEAHRGRAVITRTDPSGVTWGLEDNARAIVRATRGTLILTLERGAVEAQVAPVAAGEAFAIDVDGSRVAVHGTHLRVAREGTRAIVDLREGVVSIGAPPAHGSTYGDLISAPAHVEFDAADPHGTLKVTHEPSRVRAANALEQQHPLEPDRPEGPSTPPPAPRPASPPAPVPASPSHAAAAPAPMSPTVAPLVPAPPMPPQADADPEKKITEAVRACVRARVGQITGVVVTVSTHVEMQVADNGMVSTAKFDPPLAPEVQECAAETIYRTRFSAPGAVSIPLDVTP